MTETRRDIGLGVGALVALPIVCCVGLSLLVGAGLGVAAVAWIGGLTFAMLALAMTVVLVLVRMQGRAETRWAPQKRKEQHEH